MIKMLMFHMQATFLVLSLQLLDVFSLVLSSDIDAERALFWDCLIQA